MANHSPVVPYRGRLAPSPTGLLHLGHARTFALAHARARTARGALLLRLEDLDRARCREEFVAAIYEDLHWAGLAWDEGPDVGGPHAPYRQSARGAGYLAALRRLAAAGWLYPCVCSRQDIARALSAPHPEDRGPLYPGTCRPPAPTVHADPATTGVNWRFRVPAGVVEVGFNDGRLGSQRQAAGRDFGDFIVWRRDGFAAYELAVVVDDAAMGITEVVRGEDLLPSTGQQLLLYEALGHRPPAFYHTALVRDATGRRLAKRDAARSLRALRGSGYRARRAGDAGGGGGGRVTDDERRQLDGGRLRHSSFRRSWRPIPR